MFRHDPKNIGKQILHGFLFGLSIAVVVVAIIFATMYWQNNREAEEIAEFMDKPTLESYDPSLHIINDYKNNPSPEPIYSPEEQAVMDDIKNGEDWIGPYSELYGLRFYQYDEISTEAKGVVSSSLLHMDSTSFFKDPIRGCDVEVWGEFEGKYVDFARSIKSGTSRFEKVKGMISGYYGNL